MNKIWSDEAWDDYEYWQTQDRKTLKKLNNLLNPKPEKSKAFRICITYKF